MKKTIEKKPVGAEEVKLPVEGADEEIIFKPQKKKKVPKLIGRIIGIIILLAVVGGAALLIYNLFFKEEKKEIITATSFITTIETKITGNGPANSKESQAVPGRAKGEVLSVFVQDGDKVEVGQPLFVVDDTELREQIATSEDTLNKASKDISDIHKEIQGQVVRAPFAGKTVDIGEEVKKGNDTIKGKKLALLVDDSKMRVTSDFSIAYLGSINVGDAAQISIPKIMTLLEGKVESIEPSKKITSEGTIVFEVTVVLDNPGTLTKGMEAMVAINTPMGEATPAAVAKLEYFREELINAGTSGQLTEILMKNQYVFSEGDVLCRITNESLTDTLSIRQKTFDEAKKNYDDIVEKLEDYAPLAEISGTVTGLSIKVGDKLTGSESQLLRVSDLTGMILEANIDELDVSKIKIGMEAQINVNGAMYTGVFTSIALEGKTEGYSGMSVFPAKIEISATEGIMTGMYMDFTCVVSRIENCIAVPSNAVRYTESGEVVFVQAVVDGMTPAEVDPSIVPEGYFAVKVVPGASDDFNIEIKEGLPEGVVVATTSQTQDPYGGMYGGGGAVMIG